MLVPDPQFGMTPFAWLKAMPVAPKADHVRELLDRLRRVRDIGLPRDTAGRVPEERLRQFVREGYASDAHQLGRYAARRRRAILVATIIDLEARLTDAVLDMADKLIGGLFAKARNATRRRYVASAGDVGRLMRMFHGTIEALAVAQENERDAFEAVDEAVGWAKLLRVRSEVENLAKLAGEDSAAPRRRPLEDTAQVRARPDRGAGVSGRARGRSDAGGAATAAELNRSGKREVPADAPMPFRKEWRRLVRTVADRTDVSTRRRSSQPCATSCARVTSGSSARPTIAGSTATCCRPPPSRRPRRSLACRRRPMSGWRTKGRTRSPAEALRATAAAGRAGRRRISRRAPARVAGQGDRHARGPRLRRRDRGDDAAVPASPSCCTR